MRELERVADDVAGTAGTTTWAPVPLQDVLDGRASDSPPVHLRRDDGRALLYAGRVHALFGEPEACKGWISLHAAAECLSDGGRVLLVDFEDSAPSVVGRLLAIGADRDEILERFTYVRPDEPLAETAVREFGQAAKDVTLAILDGVTEALTLHGLDLASNTDVAKWLEKLPRRLARAGAAVVLIDHVVKDREHRGRYAIGAQHKLAGVDCAYSVKVLEPFGRGRDGRVQITVTKDRPGHVRGAAVDGRVADVYLTSEPDGAVTVTLHATTEGSAATFRPTVLMERVSRAVEERAGLSKRAIRDAVRGRAKHVDLARELLTAEGFIRARQDGQADRYESLRPYRSTGESDRVLPRPDRVPDAGGSPVSPVSPPVGTRGRGTDTTEAPTASHSTGHGRWDDSELQALIDQEEQTPMDHSLTPEGEQR
jgi:KaiC/GvpD/RAD55 family RecA-like ATPase